MLFINAADRGECDDAKAWVKEQVDCGRGRGRETCGGAWNYGGGGQERGQTIVPELFFRLPLCTNNLINT